MAWLCESLPPQRRTPLVLPAALAAVKAAVKSDPARSQRIIKTAVS